MGARLIGAVMSGDSTPQVSPELLAKWEAQQAQQKARLSFEAPDGFDPAAVRYIGGVDLSFFTSKKLDVVTEEYAVAGLAIVEFPSLKLVKFESELVPLDVPYVPGFLAYREAPAVLRLLAKVRREAPELFPDALLVDGNGVLHPRGFGLASHVGVEAGVPTVGVGKTFLQAAGWTRPEVDAEAALRLGAPGAAFYLQPRPGHAGFPAPFACVACTGGSRKPVYVSVGSNIDLPAAVALVQRCARFRIPEPIRQADLLTRQRVREVRALE
eukprot:gnl/Chilomastix_cuspidata/3403.p1 GENE.gnl/Chilomastix_cuspidata/3403~~gnl/Chilomastix_cuspidata/3403.p1  ORF type:complete len:270 (+),score=140.08 gnl/Chilomastix_cuspidata/3403:458-1267(+)